MVTHTALQPYRGSYLTPAVDKATVVDALHPGVFSCDPSTPLADVARIMATHRVHCVVVAGIRHRDGDDRLVWSIVSDLDLIRAALTGDDELVAADLAGTPAVTVDTSEPLTDAMQMMAEHEVSHLVVTARGDARPVGVLSTLDVANVLAWGS